MSVTPKMIFEDKLAPHISGNKELSQHLTAIYQFNITGNEGGNWHIDLSPESNQVVPGSADNPNCTITIADADFVNLVEGRLNPQMAFMTGKLKVKGDLGLALKLGKILKA